jgi:MFS family permease
VKREERYLLDQSPEVTAEVNASGWAKRLGASFPALQSRNYRLYFFGQLISVIGTWLQIVAQGWLVLHLANSPFLIGLVAALATAPALLFSLFGGVVVDRFSKKRILFFTQSAQAVLALSLGVLTLAGLVTIPVLCVIAFLMGSVNAVDAPARQAFVSEMVGPEQLSSAIALNSGIFNTGRALGPALAGLLIATVGTGGAFIVNGLSYLAIIAALRYMRIDEQPIRRHLRLLQAIGEGIRYSFAHPVIRVLLVFAGAVSIFGWSYATLLPLIARNRFGLDATGLGYLYMATGLGSLLATYLVGAYAQRVRPVLFIVGGTTLFALCLAAFGFTRSFAQALPLLFLTGLGLLSQSAMTTTIIQRMVQPAFRGRVMSIYILMFLGMAPVGNFEVGALSERFGIPWTIAFNAAVVLAVGWVVFFNRKKIRAAYQKYKA